MPAIIGTSRGASIICPRTCRKGRILVRRLLYVAFFVEVGLLLIVVPWSGFWDHNYFAAVWPPLRPLADSNFVRGGVTGLGVVNLCAGFADLVSVFTGPRAAVDDRAESHLR